MIERNVELAKVITDMQVGGWNCCRALGQTVTKKDPLPLSVLSKYTFFSLIKVYIKTWGTMVFPTAAMTTAYNIQKLTSGLLQRQQRFYSELGCLLISEPITVFYDNEWDRKLSQLLLHLPIQCIIPSFRREQGEAATTTSNISMETSCPTKQFAVESLGKSTIRDRPQ